MIGVEVERIISKLIIHRCLEKGIYFGLFGQSNNVLRICPPVTIDYNSIKKVVCVLKQTIKEIENNELPIHIHAQAQKCKSLGN